MAKAKKVFEKINYGSLMGFKKNISYDDATLINFVNLTAVEKEMVRTWRNHENVRKWSYQDQIISMEEHVGFIEKLKADNRNFYWLVRNKREEYIGVISLIKVDFKNKNAYLGIYSNPDLSGNGKLLMECLKRLAFETANLHTLKLEVIEGNERAINFYKKAGFREEGKLKELVFKNGKWKDVIVMGIINREVEEE